MRVNVISPRSAALVIVFTLHSKRFAASARECRRYSSGSTHWVTPTVGIEDHRHMRLAREAELSGRKRSSGSPARTSRATLRALPVSAVLVLCGG
jgi:hypothetical protein